MNNEELFNEVARNVAQMLGRHMPFVLVAQPITGEGALACVTNVVNDGVKAMCSDLIEGHHDVDSEEKITVGTKQ